LRFANGEREFKYGLSFTKEKIQVSKKAVVSTFIGIPKYDCSTGNYFILRVKFLRRLLNFLNRFNSRGQIHYAIQFHEQLEIMIQSLIDQMMVCIFQKLGQDGNLMNISILKLIEKKIILFHRI